MLMLINQPSICPSPIQPEESLQRPWQTATSPTQYEHDKWNLYPYILLQSNTIIPCPKWYPPFRSYTKILQIFLAFFIFIARASGPRHFVLLYLIALIISGNKPHITFTIHPLLSPSMIKIFSLAPCSQTSPICISPPLFEGCYHLPLESKKSEITRWKAESSLCSFLGIRNLGSHLYRNSS
jgi:hypothetical protein